MTELKDHAVSKDTAGTGASAFSELFPPITSDAPHLRCSATGTVYPNQPPFSARSDMLEPYWGDQQQEVHQSATEEAAPKKAAPKKAAPKKAAPTVAQTTAPIADDL